MRINRYRFGEIIINERRYLSDVIIYPDRVVDNWRRKRGHLLLKEDLGDVLGFKPTLLIIGTGAFGLMKVPNETEDYITSGGVELRTAKTGDACDIFNKTSTRKKVVAALHITC